MSTRIFPYVVLLLWALALGSTAVRAQTQGDDAAESSFKTPRTPWGDPDLQGVWDYRTITPMERPPELGDREFYTDEEIAELEGRAAESLDEPPDEGEAENFVHSQYTIDRGRHVDEARRTSLIVDPPNGRIPELTAAARERRAAGRNEAPSDPTKPWLSRSLLERCVTRGFPQAILPSVYNNNIAIEQAPNHVAIVHEMVHETRIVPLDGRDYTGLPAYMGESRGHWEGDTLVVETRNFNDEVSFRGAGKNLRVIERYTRAGPETIEFEMTIEDETTWTEPWTVAYHMRPTEGEIHEYACHEGNRGLRNILENMRNADAAAGN